MDWHAGFHPGLFAGEGGGRGAFLHGAINWMRAKHAYLRGVGECPSRIFILKICCSENLSSEIEY